MKLGKEALLALRAEITGNLAPGDELVVAGPVAAQGTAVIAEKKEKELRKYFSVEFIRDCHRLLKDYGTGMTREENKIWDMAEDAGADAIYLMGEGGFLSALWKMSEASGTGLKADLRSVPIRQETVEVCERFDLNPYRLLSGGSILIGMKGGEGFAQELRRMGYMAAVVGQADSGNDRLLYSGENARYLERPYPDEISKLQEGESWEY